MYLHNLHSSLLNVTTKINLVNDINIATRIQRSFTDTLTRRKWSVFAKVIVKRKVHHFHCWQCNCAASEAGCRSVRCSLNTVGHSYWQVPRRTCSRPAGPGGTSRLMICRRTVCRWDTCCATSWCSSDWAADPCPGKCRDGRAALERCRRTSSSDRNRRPTSALPRQTKLQIFYLFSYFLLVLVLFICHLSLY